MKVALDWFNRRCPVCEAHNFRVLFRDRNRREGYDVETDLVECISCGMRYLNPIPVASSWLSKYDVGYQQTQSKVRPEFVRYIMYIADQLVAQICSRDMHLHYAPRGLGENRKILDIGCGTGEKLKDYHRRGFQTYGIDISPTAIARARKMLSGDFQIGDFETASYPDDFFDVVRFDNVLEHIYNPRAFLQKVYQVLRPGGTAYGYVPNGNSPSMRYMGKYSVSSWIPFHINLFTPATLDKLARETGFKTHVSLITNPNWVALSIYQWRNRNRKKINFSNGFLSQKISMSIVAPISWLFKKMGMGEELCLKAIRPIMSLSAQAHNARQ